MKKSILLLSLIAIAGVANAQGETVTNSKKIKLKSVGVELGLINDVFSKMNLESMYDLTKNTALLDRDLSGLDENLNRNSAGIRIGVSTAFSASSKEGNRFITNREVRFGGFYSKREPLISYNSSDENGNYKSIIYCNNVNELSANGAYVIRKSPVRAKWFSVYAGIGASVGSSFNTDVIVMESEFDGTSSIVDPQGNSNTRFDGKSSLFSRIYVPIGLDFTVAKHFQFGTEVHLGAGMQNVYGGNTYMMPFSFALTNKFSWVF